MNQAWKQSEFLYELSKIRELAEKLLPESITARLEMHDWQNCMCEIFKFHKPILGLGTPKQLYR